MPKYTFKLSDDHGGVEDDVGVNLPDAEIAYSYACDVVHELMKGREPTTRSWRLDVYENEQEKVFEIPFAALDPTLDHAERATTGGRTQGTANLVHVAAYRGRQIRWDCS